MSQVECDPNCASLETASCQTETTKDKSKRMDSLHGRPKKKKEGGKMENGAAERALSLVISPNLQFLSLFPFLPHPTPFDAVMQAG